VYLFLNFMLMTKATFFEENREIFFCFVSDKCLVRQSKCFRVTRQILHNTQYGNMRHYCVTSSSSELRILLNGELKRCGRQP
jgi:hypothetical protein